MLDALDLARSVSYGESKRLVALGERHGVDWVVEEESGVERDSVKGGSVRLPLR